MKGLDRLTTTGFLMLMLGYLLSPAWALSASDSALENQIPAMKEPPQLEIPLETTKKRYQFSPEVMISFPQPLMIGLEVSRTDMPNLRVYLDGGYFQYPFSITRIGIKAFSVETGVRYFPFDSWFCLSLGVGYRRITPLAQFSSWFIANDYQIEGSVMKLNTVYIAPMVEAKFDVSKRISISFGIGLQLPVIASTSLSFITDDSVSSSDLYVDSFPYLDRVANILIPRVTLFRLNVNLD